MLDKEVSLWEKRILVLLKEKEEVHSGILSFQVLVEDSPPKINIGFG